MTKHSEAKAAAALAETYEKAKALYATLVSLTESPREATDCIMMMHLLLFINHGKPGTEELMLEEYCRTFRLNYNDQVETSKANREKMN